MRQDVSNKPVRTEVDIGEAELDQLEAVDLDLARWKVDGLAFPDAVAAADAANLQRGIPVRRVSRAGADARATGRNVLGRDLPDGPSQSRQRVLDSVLRDMFYRRE